MVVDLPARLSRIINHPGFFRLEYDEDGMNPWRIGLAPGGKDDHVSWWEGQSLGEVVGTIAFHLDLRDRQLAKKAKENQA